MAISDWPERWEALRRAYARRGLVIHNWRLEPEEGDGTPNTPGVGPYYQNPYIVRHTPNPPAILEVEPPATEAEVAAVEKELGRAIPPSFRRVLSEYSRAVDVCRMFPELTGEWNEKGAFETVYDGRFRYFPWGTLYWSLAELPALHRQYAPWLTDCFKDQSNEYDRHWHGKFPFYVFGCENFLAIEDNGDGRERVVFLSHDGDDRLNGYPLGRDFEDFVDRMSLLGCPDDGLWIFLEPPEPYLKTDGENARLWREWFGLV